MEERKQAYIFTDDARKSLHDFILVRMEIELMNLYNVNNWREPGRVLGNWWEHGRLLNEEDKRTGMVEINKEGHSKSSIETWLKGFYEHEGYKVSVVEADKKREITAAFGEEQFKVDVTETDRKFQILISKLPRNSESPDLPYSGSS